MSDVAQGPGWWQASDGRWYAPELHPNYVPPGPPPPVATQPPLGYWQAADGQWYPPQMRANAYVGPPPKTNGTAVASLVLSLVWLGGLGSLLAVIFGITSRRAIRASRGTQTGAGLALAGLIIGIIGLLGAILLYVTIAAVNHNLNNLNDSVQASETPTNVAMGTKVAVGDPDNSGITSVTVTSFTAPVPGASDGPAPDPGKEYAAAAAEVCAGGGGSQSGVADLNFSLGFTGGQTADPSLIPTVAPDLGHIGALAANACSTGYVSFEIASGTTPTYVAYQPGLIHQYRWQVAG